MQKLIPLGAVLGIAGIGKTATYDGMAAGKFPKPCKVGRRSLWVESEVQEWVEHQIAERDDRATTAGAIATNRAIVSEAGRSAEFERAAGATPGKSTEVRAVTANRAIQHGARL